MCFNNLNKNVIMKVYALENNLKSVMSETEN